MRNRQTDRERDMQTDRQAERERQRETDRRRERQTETERQSEAERERQEERFIKSMYNKVFSSVKDSNIDHDVHVVMYRSSPGSDVVLSAS